MAYIKSDKNQNWLLPPSIKQMIPEDHICFFVEEFVESLDFSKIDMINEGPGHPSYHPRILMKILIQGMISRERSSRKLSTACKENIVFMYLAEKVQPSFKTICRFRANNSEFIKDAFKETIKLASEYDLVDLSLICVDGSKIKANASKRKYLNMGQLEELSSAIDDMVDEDIKSEEDEDSSSKEDHLTKRDRKGVREIVNTYRQSKNKEVIRQRIEDAKEHLEKDKENGKVSLTDPDSKMARSKRGASELNYNTQLSVDSKSQIILANDVCSDVTDMYQLVPQVEQVKENVRLKKDTSFAFDCGYNDSRNFVYLEEQGIDAYIPNQVEAQRQQGREITAKQDNYEYDFDTNEILWKGEKLRQKCSWFDSSKKKTMYFFSSKDGKTTKKVPEGFRERLRMKYRVRSDTGKKICSMRKHVVEPVFANIKYNMGLDEFSTRNFKNIKMELNIASITHNLKKIHKARISLTSNSSKVAIIIDFTIIF